MSRKKRQSLLCVLVSVGLLPGLLRAQASSTDQPPTAQPNTASANGALAATVPAGGGPAWQPTVAALQGKEAARWGHLLRYEAWLFITALLAVFAHSTRSEAFKVSVQLFEWPAIHEEITTEVIGSVTSRRNRLMANNSQSGVYSTVLSQQLVKASHFENSTMSNGGLENGSGH